MLLSMLFAVSLTGCGRTDGGASEVTAAGPSAEQPSTNIRVAEATQGTTSSQSTGVVEDGVYEVCDVKNAGDPKWGYSEDKKPTGPHLELNLQDEIWITKGGPNSPLGKVVFKHFKTPEQDREKRAKLNPQETPLTVINCCKGETLGATRGFEHGEARKTALHGIIIKNVPETAQAQKILPAACAKPPVIVVQYCYPTTGDDGTDGWTCGGRYPQTSQNPHGGDVHATLTRRLP